METARLNGSFTVDPIGRTRYANILVRSAALVSEPSILALMGLGFLAMLGINRRKVQV